MLAVAGTKTCRKCGNTKPTEAFGKSSRAKDGLQWRCRACLRAADRERYRRNPAKTVARVNQYRKDNAEAHLARCRNRVARDRAKYRAVNRAWYAQNREAVLAHQRDYFQASKPAIVARRRERRQTDVGFRLSCNLRSRLYHAIREHAKTGSAVRDLGCSIDELKSYLAKMFSDGMAWGNYSEWEIDHIQPLASFDLTDPAQVKQACHYTNLQPLWAAENRSKGARIVEVA